MFGVDFQSLQTSPSPAGPPVPANDVAPEKAVRIENDSSKTSVYYRGRRVTGLCFGRGGDLSFRIYDKTEEVGMRTRTAESARRAVEAREKASREAELWTRHGWQEGEAVTRVEVQVRGQALDELCRRCEVAVDRVRPEEQADAEERAMRAMAGELEHAIDGIWQYATRRWLVLIVPEETRSGAAQRKTRCKVDPWWQDVQRVSFHRQTEEPFTRERRSSAARSSQVLGAALSIAAMHGHHSPWVDTRGPKWVLPDEHRAARLANILGGAGDRLSQEVTRLFEEVAPIVVQDLVRFAGGDEQALERLIVRWSGATARYAPEVEEVEGGQLRVRNGQALREQQRRALLAS